MSIAHLNPENRTMNNLVQLPNNRRIALTRSTHRCSFCLTQGHNINTCDDNRLIYIENECMQQKQLCSFDENAIILFRNWLCAKVLHNSLLIKAFAVRKCGARIRSNIDECIENIVNYIYQDSNNDYNLDAIMPSLYQRMLMFIHFEEAEMEINLDRKFNVVSKVEDFDTEENFECAICYDDNIMPTNIVKLNCTHKFCNTCVKKSFQHTTISSIPCCALCRSETSSITFKNENTKNEFCNIISI
jgi:hypothetical protein